MLPSTQTEGTHIFCGEMSYLGGGHNKSVDRASSGPS